MSGEDPPKTLLETVAEKPKSEEFESEPDTALSTEDEDGATGYTIATDDVALHDQGSDLHQPISPIPGTSGIARHPGLESISEMDLAAELHKIEDEILKNTDGTNQTEAWRTAAGAAGAPGPYGPSPSDETSDWKGTNKTEDPTSETNVPTHAHRQGQGRSDHFWPQEVCYQNCNNWSLMCN